MFLDIMFDSILIRMFLVPAIMLKLKSANWWIPFGLARVKPEEERLKKV